MSLKEKNPNRTIINVLYLLHTYINIYNRGSQPFLTLGTLKMYNVYLIIYYYIIL